MFYSTVIRRCLLPAAVVVAEAKLTTVSQEADSDSSSCRPSELPIYTPDPPATPQEAVQTQEPELNFVESSVRSLRERWLRYSQEVAAYEKVAKESLNESKQNVEWLVNFLRKDDNTLPKVGAIGIGALTGLVFGLRGGFFKRTLYATTGALGMAAVCYPKEASQYAQVGAGEGKKMLTVAYNFVYGDDSSAVNVQHTKNVTSVSSKDLENELASPSTNQELQHESDALCVVPSPAPSDIPVDILPNES